MRNWDGTMSTDSAAPTVAYFSRKKLEELLLKPKLGDDWKQYRWFMSPVWLENVLSHQPARWLPQGYANYDALLTAAVEGAVSDAEAPTCARHVEVGTRASRGHQASLLEQLSHPQARRRPGPQPLSGDGETVKQVGTHFGPSERSRLISRTSTTRRLNIVNGQSGNIFDEHYNDQWDAYYHGRTFALPFSAAGGAAGGSASSEAGAVEAGASG